MKSFIKSYLWLPALIGIAAYFRSIFYESAWGDDQLTISPISKDFSLMLKTFYDNSRVPGLHFCPIYFFQCYLINLIFGKSAFPFGFHLYQLILTAISCILAAVILYKITKNKLVSILITSLWIVHPLNVEIVTRLGCGPAQLASSTFCLAFMLCFLKVREVESDITKSILATLGILFFLACMTTHEQFFFFPLVILLLCFYFEEKKIFTKKGNLLFVVSPLILIYPLYLSWRFFACGETLYETSNELIKWTEVGSLKDILFRAFWLAPQLIVHYFRLFFFPDFLAESQADWFKVGDSIWSLYSLFCQLLVLVLILCSIFFYKKLPLFSIGMFWFFVSMILVIQIVPLYLMIDEHYCYLPILGLFLSIFSFVIYLWEKLSLRLLVVFMLPIFCLLTWRTELYIPNGKNYITNIVAIAEHAPPWIKVLHMDEALGLARSLHRENELPAWINEESISAEADKWIKKYLYVEPALSYKFGPMQSVVNFGLYKRFFGYLFLRGELEKLHTLINQSLKARSDWLSLHQVAGFLSNKNSFDLSLVFFKKAIELNPRNSNLYDDKLLKIAFYGHRFSEVESLIKQYLTVNPDSSHPYLYAGSFYSLFDESKEISLSYFKSAISKDKKISISSKNMYLEAAEKFIDNGLFNLAMEALKIVNELDPDNLKAEKLLLKLKVNEKPNK